MAQFLHLKWGFRLYIPIDDFQSSGEYGCYTLEIEIHSQAHGSGESISDTMFYEYTINGDTDHGTL